MNPSPLNTRYSSSPSYMCPIRHPFLASGSTFRGVFGIRRRHVPKYSLPIKKVGPHVEKARAGAGPLWGRHNQKHYRRGRMGPSLRNLSAFEVDMLKKFESKNCSKDKSR